MKPTLLLYGRIPPPSQSASRPVGQSVLSAKHVSVAGFGSPYAPLRREKKNGAAAFRFPIGLRSGRLHRRRHSPQPDRGMGVKGRKDDF